MAEYKDIFSPKTLAGLKGQSEKELAQITKGKSLRQMLDKANQLIWRIQPIEADYKKELEDLAVTLAKETYPVIEYAGIGIDAKLGSDTTLGKSYQTDPKLKEKYDIIIHARGAIFPVLMHEIAKGLYEIISKQAYYTKISPEKRRIINSITQGAAVQGAFSYHLYKDFLDLIDPELVNDYTNVMDATFGGYHDETHIAKLMSIIDRYGDQLTGVGRINVSFPKRTEKGDEEATKVTQQVDTYKNELDDIRYGKFIYNSVNNLWIDSGYDDSRVRDLFLAELYKLEDYNEFQSFVENVINNELTEAQKRWALGEMRDIYIDLKKDDTGLTGLGEQFVRMNRLAGLLK